MDDYKAERDHAAPAGYGDAVWAICVAEDLQPTGHAKDMASLCPIRPAEHGRVFTCQEQPDGRVDLACPVCTRTALRERFGLPARALARELELEPEPEPKPKPAAWPDPMDDAAFYGLAGQFVRTIEPHSESDPAALLVQFLAVFGCSAGAGSGWRVDGTLHPGRLWPLLVGSTGRGRKGTSTGRVRQVFEHVEPGWWREHMRAGLASGEGVVWHVRDPITKRRKPKKGETPNADGYVVEVEDPGVDDKRLCVIEAEFAHVLAVMRRESNTLSATLREFWDHGSYGSLTKHDAVTATDAHIVVIGHVTPREVRERLTATDQVNGFANRFLTVCVRRSKSLPFGGKLEGASLALLATRIRDALTAARKIKGALGMTSAAAQLWDSVYDDLSDGADDLAGAMRARAEPHVLRLSVVYALLDGSRDIDRAHVEAALAVWRYCEDSAAYVFGGRAGNPMAERLLAMMRDAAGITRSELRDGVSHDTPSERFDAALDYLEDGGLARRERERTAGRPRERWYAESGRKGMEGTKPPAILPSVPFIPHSQLDENDERAENHDDAERDTR